MFTKPQKTIATSCKQGLKMLLFIVEIVSSED